MKLKKIILGITLFTTVVSSSGVTAIAAEADEGNYRTGTVDAYVYKLDDLQKLECRYYEDMPNIPYVKLSDYYKLWTDQTIEITNNNDGTYIVKVPHGESGVFDVDKNFISVDDPEFYLPESVFSNDSIYADNYLKYDTGEEAIPPKVTDIDLEKYHIDIYGDDNDIWIPLATLCDIFTRDDKEAFWMDGAVYFCEDRSSDFSIMEAGSDEQINNYIEKYKDGRPEDLAVFNYNELCLSVDITYGFPREIPHVSILGEKGMDSMLSEGSETTRKIKDLLLSTDLAEYSLGVNFLNNYFDDGGHTFFQPNGLFSPEIGSAAVEKLDSLGISLDIDVYSDDSYANMEKTMMGAMEAQNKMMSSADKVIIFSEASCYIEKGDTAVFSFGLFAPDVEKWYSYYHENGDIPEDIITDFHKALVTADNNPDIKRFVIDLGTNFGGLSYAVEYMMGIIAENNTASFKVYGVDDPFVINYTVDKNLDKVIDDKDTAFRPDLQYGVLVSNASVSCANWFASLAHDNNILLIGEQSGGLGCAVVGRTTPDGTFYNISSSVSLIDKNGESIELGIKPDFEWVKTDKDGNKDYSDVYDFEKIGQAFDEFYGNAKDKETDTGSVTTTVTTVGKTTETTTTTSAAKTSETTSTATQSTAADTSKTTEAVSSANVTTVTGDTAQENTTELPQTGNNSKGTIAAVASSLTLITVGAAFAYLSGAGRKKKEN